LPRRSTHLSRDCMEERPNRDLRHLEDGRLIRLPVVSRWLLVVVLLAAAGSAFLVATGHVEDWGAILLGLVLLLIAIPIIGVLVYHLIFSLLLPFELVASAIQTRKERRQQREQAISLAGSGPVDVRAPNADRALGWGLASLVFPPVGFVGIWYGRDALRLIRLSGGALGGERMARAGLRLGVIGTIELILLVVLVATYPSS